MIFTTDFPEGDTLVFRDTGDKSPPGHITNTMCEPNIMAALQSHWKDDVMPWPFVRLAGEVASAGKTGQAQKEQAISYLHYLLLARPDLQVAQGLLLLRPWAYLVGTRPCCTYILPYMTRVN